MCAIILTTCTLPDKPSKPGEPLKISNVTEKTADLEWSPPSSDGGLPLTGYVIEVRQSSRSTWGPAGKVDDKTTTFTAKELVAGNEYNFRVMAVNDEGESVPLESTVTAKPVKKIGTYDCVLVSVISICVC
jgi:hypothetical protein